MRNTICFGEQKVAAACGFQLKTEDKQDDAYQLAQYELRARGFEDFSRADIKQAYMPVFYGQAAPAFEKLEAFGDVDNDEARAKTEDLFRKVHGSLEPDEEKAKLFHGAMEAAFGSRTKSLRAEMAKMAGDWDREEEIMEKHVVYRQVDGQMVGMSYMKTLNIYGMPADAHDSVIPDVLCKTNGFTFKGKKMTFATNEINHGNHARNHFVNFIQGTDALMARLIGGHAADRNMPLIAVLDCFRTDINHMLNGNLVDCIRDAYMELFGSEINIKSEHLPLGQDMLEQFSLGVQKARKPEYANMSIMKQFRTARQVRMSRKVNGKTYKQIISEFSGGSVGSSYFFDK